MLISGKKLLDTAYKNNFAVGAFNINNLEFLKSIINACEQNNSPVIIQTSEGAIKYAGHENISSMVKTIANSTDIPVVLHLDHGTTYETIINCIKYGYTSIMIDASHYELKENIAKTKEIVKIAHSCGVSVEAELGRLSGIEDQISVDEKDALYTNVEEAKIFVQETAIDTLAVAIGTAHGVYKGVPKLDFERLEQLNNALNIPLVLHGASGIPYNDIETAISMGISKINIDTDLRLAFSNSLRETIKNDSESFDPRKLFKDSNKAIENVVEEKIKVFKSVDKKHLYY